MGSTTADNYPFSLSMLCCFIFASVALEPDVELADYVLADVPLEDVLEEGLRRLSSKETWKIWQFDGQEFYDAESFRNHIHEHHIKEELLRLLPKDDPKGTERPAEAALRQRMTDLLTQVQVNNRQAQDEQQGSGGQQGGSSGGRGRRAPRSNPEQTAGLIRDGNVEVISTMLEALEKEHEQLYQSLLKPITTFVIDLLPVSTAACIHATHRMVSSALPCVHLIWTFPSGARLPPPLQLCSSSAALDITPSPANSPLAWPRVCVCAEGGDA